MTCLNPKLKIESIRRILKNINFQLTDVTKDDFNNELDEMCNRVEKSEESSKFL